MKRLRLVRTFYISSQIGDESSSYLLGSCRSYYSNALSNGSNGKFKSSYPYLFKGHYGFALDSVKTLTLRSTKVAELSIFTDDKRMVTTQAKPSSQSQTTQPKPSSQTQTTQAKAPPQARKMGQSLTILSPGFVYDPYEPREKIPLWKRLFTKSGWTRTKSDMIMELRSAYAIVKLRKTGYSKSRFYTEAVAMYKEINTLIANGDKKSLRKAVTERMFSILKNEIKQRETKWSRVYWELVEPVVMIRTLRARLIGIDPKDQNKAFIQLTLEIMAKQKFEAYDLKGSVAAGDKKKEVLVRDIWVFEKSLFLNGAYWRLCGRISPKAS